MQSESAPPPDEEDAGHDAPTDQIPTVTRAPVGAHATPDPTAAAESPKPADLPDMPGPKHAAPPEARAESQRRRGLRRRRAGEPPPMPDPDATATTPQQTAPAPRVVDPNAEPVRPHKPRDPKRRNRVRLVIGTALVVIGLAAGIVGGLRLYRDAEADRQAKANRAELARIDRRTAVLRRDAFQAVFDVRDTQDAVVAAMAAASAYRAAADHVLEVANSVASLANAGQVDAARAKATTDAPPAITVARDAEAALQDALAKLSELTQ